MLRPRSSASPCSRARSAAGKHVYSEKPVAPTPSRGLARLAPAGEGVLKHGTVEDKVHLSAEAGTDRGLLVNWRELGQRGSRSPSVGREDRREIRLRAWATWGSGDCEALWR